MKKIRHLAFLLLLVPLCPAEIVDRVVAVVNKQVVLQSELEQTARVEFLLSGRPLAELSDSELQVVLDHLIDQALLEQQIASTPIPDTESEELDTQVHDVRSRIPGAQDDEHWRSLIATYGVTQHDVETQLRAQLRILRFIDMRFRTLARVDRPAILTYYDEKLGPQLRSQGAAVPPLADVSSKIEKLLVEERINDLLNTWLQTLRSQSRIRRITPGVPATGGRP